MTSWAFSWRGQEVDVSVEQVFASLPLKISNAANHEKCVSQKYEQHLYWSIFECLNEI
jgi:hypothetical protein